MNNIFSIFTFISILLISISCLPKYKYSPYFHAVPSPSLSGEILSFNTTKVKDTSCSYIKEQVLGRDNVYDTYKSFNTLEYCVILFIHQTQNDTTYVLSDNQGKFEKKLQAGIYTIRFIQNDYNILEIQYLSIKLGDYAMLNVILGSVGSSGQKNNKSIKIEN
ncbi:MAG: hypothetical protein MUC49_02555 [Raineya sp.]|jgi:hypothetical protein|nr:hypothetical protein [Raineya sp.]